MSNLNYYDDNMTVEWINDVKYMRSSPHPNHGIVNGELLNNFYNYLKEKPGDIPPG